MKNISFLMRALQNFFSYFVHLGISGFIAHFLKLKKKPKPKKPQNQKNQKNQKPHNLKKPTVDSQVQFHRFLYFCPSKLISCALVVVMTYLLCSRTSRLLHVSYKTPKRAENILDSDAVKYTQPNMSKMKLAMLMCLYFTVVFM